MQSESYCVHSQGEPYWCPALPCVSNCSNQFLSGTSLLNSRLDKGTAPFQCQSKDTVMDTGTSLTKVSLFLGLSFTKQFQYCFIRCNVYISVFESKQTMEMIIQSYFPLRNAFSCKFNTFFGLQMCMKSCTRTAHAMWLTDLHTPRQTLMKHLIGNQGLFLLETRLRKPSGNRLFM